MSSINSTTLKNKKMKKGNTYKIIGETNQWIANRDPIFKGKTNITIDNGLSLKVARKMLLAMFNMDYDTWYPNWGVAVNATKNNVDGAVKTYNDGTRSYTYDSRRYSIELEC